MNRIILTFGIIGGLLVALLMFATRPLWIGAEGEMDMKTGEVLGYISMIISLSVIFFGIRSYRDNHLTGTISFWKAFQVGILITLVASIIYVAGWMIYYHTSEEAQNFPEQYLNYMLANLEESGLSQDEIDEKEAAYREQMELYKNPLIMAAVSLFEIFPVGLIITLLCAFILKRTGGRPASAFADSTRS